MRKLARWLADNKFNTVDILGYTAFGSMFSLDKGWWSIAVLLCFLIVSVLLEAVE